MAAASRHPLRQRLMAWMRPRQAESLPIRLDRRRVYILPTRFGLFFALLLLAMWIGALNYNNNPALMLCLLLAGAANTSLLTAHLQLTGLNVVALAADPVPAGAVLDVRLNVRAEPGRQRRGLQVDIDGVVTTLSLADGHGQAVLSLPTQRRGWLEPGRIRISTTRPLGLARAWAYVWPDSPLLVYPAPESHGPALPDGTGTAPRARLQVTGDDVHHLRAYRRGDARRAIAWKPSARRNTLLVREFEQPVGADVVLDWQQIPMRDGEGRIRRLARWVDEAEREGRRYVLRLPGQSPLGPGSGALHRHACLRALALLPPSGVAA